MEEQEEKPLIWYLHPLRVRYQETDQMGVVFHGNYATWFEIGRTELVRHLSMSYKEIEAAGLLLPVVDLACKFILPAKYDDTVLVCTAVEQFSPVRISFRSEVRRVTEEAWQGRRFEGEVPPGELLVQGGTKHVWVNAEFRPSRLDKAMPDHYAALRQAVREERGR
ncbi:acyl-CoA thioesterase [Paenibacillus methanolicus]|uniref:Acyl-CoA thioester hydrolase n=1 Tax=Paenibacillus methanolicus TaxID=582686 RepID=A0A5S5BXY5_9BACL|nr:thioesterase family protein [Paenibacillus methanolicus]TYP71166.1 acyl-CoA thioester hydrolase [Paenibacillus methanolicus]